MIEQWNSGIQWNTIIKKKTFPKKFGAVHCIDQWILCSPASSGQAPHCGNVVNMLIEAFDHLTFAMVFIDLHHVLPKETNHVT